MIVPWFFFSGWADRRDEFHAGIQLSGEEGRFSDQCASGREDYSAVFVHLFFVLFIIYLILLYGHFPDLYYLQLFYYTGGLCLLI